MTQTEPATLPEALAALKAQARERRAAHDAAKAQKQEVEQRSRLQALRSACAAQLPADLQSFLCLDGSDVGTSADVEVLIDLPGSLPIHVLFHRDFEGTWTRMPWLHAGRSIKAEDADLLSPLECQPESLWRVEHEDLCTFRFFHELGAALVDAEDGAKEDVCENNPAF